MEEIQEYIPTEDDLQNMAQFHEIIQVEPMMLPLTTHDLELKKDFIKGQILSGYLNPLEFYRRAKMLSEMIDELKKDSEVLACVSTEIEKYGKEKPVINGATIQKQSKSTPNYSACGDSVYNELKEKLKAREMFLKNLPPEGTVDPTTGEFIKPPTFSETEYITVKL